MRASKLDIALRSASFSFSKVDQHIHVHMDCVYRFIYIYIYIYIYTDALMTWLVNFRLTTGDLQGIFATNKRKQLMIILGFQRLKETLSLTLISKAVDSFFLVNNMFYRSSSVVI